MTFDEASERPFETIMSGPVAGAEGAGELQGSLKIQIWLLQMLAVQVLILV